MKTLMAFMLCVVLHVCPGVARAQHFVDSDQRRAIIELAAKALRERYIFPNTAERAAATIEAGLATGSYDDLADPQTFAERVTKDLREVTGDRHLRLVASPPAPALRRPAAIPDLGRVEVLAGNIGYLEVRGFPEIELFVPAFDSAMAALSKTSALIVDLRDNTGGAVNASRYMTSYFIPGDEPVRLGQVITRNPGLPATFSVRDNWSAATSGKYLGRPILLLTSPRTFSGAEAVAYTLQGQKLARTVGETTGGGAHPTTTVQLGGQFTLRVPFARGEGAASKTDWEGTGVIPDIPVPEAAALEVAVQSVGRQAATYISE